LAAAKLPASVNEAGSIERAPDGPDSQCGGRGDVTLVLEDLLDNSEQIFGLAGAADQAECLGLRHHIFQST